MWLGWVLAAGAATVGSPIDGWAVTVPEGWRAVPQDGAWVLGADGQPGLVLVTWTHGATYADLVAQASAGLTDQGMVLAPVSKPIPFTVGAAKAVAADYQGTSADGAGVGAHAVGVAGPSGGLVVLGLAPAVAAPELARKVDAIAGSVTFGAGDAGAVASLAGSLCASSPGEVYTATRAMTFDGAGRLTTGTSFVDTTAAKQGGGAPWSVESAAPGATYAVAGEDVVVRFPGGAERRCTVAGRDGSRITALTCAGTRWDAASCAR
jgi:hypothetical protein